MLKIEVIKFEAMDVITASTPEVGDTVECICGEGDGNWHWQNVEVPDHGDCTANEHPNCTCIN